MRGFIELLVCPYDVGAEATEFEGVKQFLSSAELAALQSFKVEDARLQFLISRYLLRKGLSEFLGLPPQELDIRRRSSGKPFVYHFDKPVRNLDFSLSHTRGMAVLLIMPGQWRCGVDVERIDVRDVKDFMSPRFFSERERQVILAGVNEEEVSANLLAHWTLKEAYLKATGEGLAGLSSEIEVVNGSEGRFVIDSRWSSVRPRKMVFQDRRIDDRFHLAMAWESGIPPLELVQRIVSCV